MTKYVAIFFIATAALAACDDHPVGVRGEVQSVLPRSVGDLALRSARISSATPYSCDVYYEAPAGLVEGTFRYRRIPLTFRGSERSSDGTSVEYRYRAYARGKSLVEVGRCTIPNTAAAKRRIDGMLNAQHPEPALRAVDKDLATIQVCEPSCSIEPIDVIACRYGGVYPNCNAKPMTMLECPALDPYCSGGDAGGGGDPGDGGGGGWEEDDPGDGTGRPPCRRDAAGHCIVRGPTTDEWQRLNARIDSIKEFPSPCKGAKDVLSALAGLDTTKRRFRLWDGYDKQIDPETGEELQRYGQVLSDSIGYYIELDSFWVWEDPLLLVHEGLHIYLNYHPEAAGGSDPHAFIYGIQGQCV